jgi:phospholipase C
VLETGPAVHSKNGKTVLKRVPPGGDNAAAPLVPPGPFEECRFSALSIPGPAEPQQRSELPPPNESGIRHIVVLMMENRSYDHFFGWIPNSDARQAGLTYFDATNQPHLTYHLQD